MIKSIFAIKRFFVKLLKYTLNLLKDLKLSTFREIKRTLIFTITVILGLIIGTFLNSLSLDVSLIKTFLENIAFQIAYVLLLIVLIVFSIVAIFKYKYKLSYWETIGFTFVFAVYWGISSESLKAFQFEPWGIHVFIPFCIILSALFVGLLVNANWSFDKKSNDYNTFLEDNPITPEKQKEDNTYNHLISKIAPALFKDVYKSSFSIGVIGPWGTGKSSFLEAVKHAVCKTSTEDLKKKYEIDIDHKPDTIFIEFSPFLNHNEEQVIHEFFTQLSNKLSERSGRLSNLITVYSEKLANLEDKNPWFSLIKLARNSRESRSAQELYDQIEDCIRQLELKIVVAVDDLDRLNAQEILQVLKLIRNTSNFPNMVFLVALDKEYVINALQEEKEYMKERYLDKFFQVEVFLNLEDSDLLKKELLSNLRKSIPLLSQKSTYVQDLEYEVYSQYSLFNFFIHNRRDVKRLLNQFKIDFTELYDSDLEELEIDIIDLYHLTYLKLHFPKSFYLLSSPSKFRSVLSSDDGKFFVKINLEEISSHKAIVQNDVFNITVRSDIIHHENGLINCFIDGNCEKKELAALLIRIFGNRHSTNPLSLTNSDVYWCYFNSTFTNKGISRGRFKKALEYNYEKNNYSNTVYDGNRRLQNGLFRNLNLIEPTKDVYSKHIKVSFYLCILSEKTSNSFFNDCAILAAKKITYTFQFFLNTKEQQREFIKRELINNTALTPLIKSKIFRHIEWGEFIPQNFSGAELRENSIQIFDQEIARIRKNWSESNLDLLRIYNNLKRYEDTKKKLNKVFIDFIFSSSEVFSTFLKQVVRPPSEGRRELYRYEVSRVVVDIFGSYTDYFLKVKVFLEDTDLEFKQELSLFHKLLLIREFKPIYFKFHKFESEVISDTLSSNMYIENTFTEVYIRVEDFRINAEGKSLYDVISGNKRLMELLNRNIIVEARQIALENGSFEIENYLILTFEESTQKDHVENMLIQLGKAVSDFARGVTGVITTSKKLEDEIVRINDQKVITLYSKQPSNE